MVITARHENGKVVITTPDFDELGEPQKTDRFISIEEAQRLQRELSEALSAAVSIPQQIPCREETA